jgi:hypothetical protein
VGNEVGRREFWEKLIYIYIYIKEKGTECLADLTTIFSISDRFNGTSRLPAFRFVCHYSDGEGPCYWIHVPGSYIMTVLTRSVILLR